MSLPTRWIICTKWAIATQKKSLASADDSQFDYQYFWTPIGSPHVYQKKSSIRGVPVSFATEDEAIAGLKKIVNDQPSLARQDLKFTALEVRYVPNKIKVYKQDWHTKYVVRELELEFKDHKFTDTIK